MTTRTEQDITATYHAALRKAAREFSYQRHLAEVAYGCKADAAEAEFFAEMDALAAATIVTPTSTPGAA